MERSYNPKTVIVQNDERGPDSRVCFYCHEKRHLIAVCPILQRKNQRKAQNSHKSVAFVRTHSSESMLSIDPTFEPFVFDGTVSFSELDTEHKHIRILRDTGAAQSFILADVLPFSTQSSCGSDVLVQGIELGVVRVPLHVVYLRSHLVTGLVKVAVQSLLPLKVISLILWNDLPGSKVSCLPEVVDIPCVSESNSVLTRDFPNLFHSCCNKVRRKEGSGQGWLVKTQVCLFKTDKLTQVRTLHHPETSTLSFVSAITLCIRSDCFSLTARALESSLRLSP